MRLDPRLLALALLVPAAAPEGGATAIAAAACTAPEHRQFDFWIGRWSVAGVEGRVLGTNEISPVAGGCGLEERWTAADGTTGVSLNFFDPRTGRWHQRWVGEGGLLLDLAGTLRDGRMVLSGGDRPTAAGRVRDRISWTPLPDGRVRQEWELSTDGGATWTAGFVGLYTRR